MKQIDKIIFSIFIWLTIPIACLLGFWWTFYYLSDNEKTIMTMALVGLCTGLAIVAVSRFFYKVDPYMVPKWLVIGVYLFYTVCLFGFFMGVPIFNSILGLLAGYYWARRISVQHKNKKTYKKQIKKVAYFTSNVMGVICLISAAIALADTHTANNLKGMLQVPFEITTPLLLTFIVAGGVLLVLFQYWITKITMKQTLKFKR